MIVWEKWTDGIKSVSTEKKDMSDRILLSGTAYVRSDNLNYQLLTRYRRKDSQLSGGKCLSPLYSNLQYDNLNVAIVQWQAILDYIVYTAYIVAFNKFR